MIPKYEEIMLPFLKHLSDGQEHGLSETVDALASLFELTDEELGILHDISHNEDLDYRIKQGGFGQVAEKYKRRNKRRGVF